MEAIIVPGKKNIFAVVFYAKYSQVSELLDLVHYRLQPTSDPIESGDPLRASQSPLRVDRRIIVLPFSTGKLSASFNPTTVVVTDKTFRRIHLKLPYGINVTITTKEHC